MIDNIIYKFFGLIDKFGEHLDNIFFPKPKKKTKKKCKKCHCKCHCKEDLHLHFDKQALCACEKCKH